MALTIDLSGKVVLICGTARGGIGGATARTMTAAGATVFAVDHDQALLDETLVDIQALGGEAIGIEADLLAPESSARIIAEVDRTAGRLDALVNIAGGTRPHQWRALEASPDQDLADVLDFNLRYVFRICREAANLMIAGGRLGAIVNTASLSARLSAPQHGFYAASKAAVVSLTRTMSAEWGPKGIRVNSVSPGAVMTERLRQRTPEGASAVDMSAFTAPEAVAAVMLFLVSDLSAGISGQDIAVDSGFSAAFSALPR